MSTSKLNLHPYFLTRNILFSVIQRKEDATVTAHIMTTIDVKEAQAEKMIDITTREEGMIVIAVNGKRKMRKVFIAR